MGLELVEIVMAAEETFGIIVSDDDAFQIRTVGEFHKYILDRREEQRQQACPTGRAFRDIRRVLTETTSTPKQAIRPSTELKTVLPPRTRRRVWNRLLQDVPGRRRALRLPFRLGPIIAGLCVVAGVTGTASRTCCAWIKTIEANRVFVSWGLNTAGRKWRMRLDATGGLRMEVNGGYHYGQVFLADDEWHHTAIVLEDDGTPDVSETLLYVDGHPETTRDVLGEPIDTDPTGEFRIGKSTYDTAGFIGLIDDVRVYDRALSDAEILSLAGGTTPIDKPF
jgi:hypothetical protein